jgi:hypothetical protein
LSGGSTIANLVLLLIVPATILAFLVARPQRATAVALVYAMLYLPQAIDLNLPVLPSVDKNTLTAVCVFGMIVLRHRELLARARFPRSYEFLILLIPLGHIGTMLTNLGPVTVFDLTLSPVRPYDAVTNSLASFNECAIPYLIGRIVYQTHEDVFELLKVLAVASVLYLPFIFIEFQLGPVMHLWVYGYMQHSYEQAVRGTGFRPMVFTAHGLALALFMHNALIATWVCAKNKGVKILGFPALIVALGMTILFPFLKSSAALMYVCLTLPAMLFLPARLQVLMATTLVGFFIVYPLGRVFTKNFVWQIVDLFARIAGAERAQSLGFRFASDEGLLQLVVQKPFFGWGGYQRSLVVPDTVHNRAMVMVPDGAWIITLGSNGFVGWLFNYIWLMGPVFLSRKRILRVDPAFQKQVAALTLIVAISTFDLCLNGQFNSLPTMIAGALAGVLYSDNPGGDKRKRILPLLAVWYVLQKRRRPVVQRA